MKQSNPFAATTLKFSLLTPCFGDDWHHFDRWLQCLKNQEYPHFEAVIIFDGPNPEGEAFLAKQLKRRKYQSLDVSFHVMTPHGGKAVAVNYGFAKTTGDMISVLDADSFLLPEALRLWATPFEDPKINRVWGYYNVEDWQGNVFPVGGGIPSLPNGQPDYWSVRFSPYIDSASPIRRSAWLPWDTTVKSLIDWEWSLRQLARTDFRGDDFVYLPRPFFIASPVDEGGLSDDSHKNWVARVKHVKELNHIPVCDSVVSSLGAVHHGLHVAKKLGWDFMPMPSFKQHAYKKIYLLGFYPGNPGTINHLQVFAKPGVTPRLRSDRVYAEDFCDATKIIHWIGTDVLKMRTEVPFLTIQGLIQTWDTIGVIHLCECTWIQKELAEIGINARIVPIPPKTLWPNQLPAPKEFTVGVYESNAQDQQMYTYGLMLETARSLPDIQFAFFGAEERKGQVDKNITHYGYTDLTALMPQMSCNLRLSLHDGLPLIPIEFLTAGRPVITNVPLEGAIKVNIDRKEIVEAIRVAQVTPLPDYIAEQWRKTMNFSTYKTIMESFV